MKVNEEQALYHLIPGGPAALELQATLVVPDSQVFPEQNQLSQEYRLPLGVLGDQETLLAQGVPSCLQEKSREKTTYISQSILSVEAIKFSTFFPKQGNFLKGEKKV